MNQLNKTQLTHTLSRSLLFAIPLATLWLLVSTPVLWAQEDEPPSSLPFRCVGVAPLDPNFCGCTWGGVYYRGQPVLGTEVSITFQEATTSTVTSQRSVDSIIYSLTGAALGARRDDLMSVSTTFAGREVERAFRARPNSEGEQNVALVIPEEGIWDTWLEEDYTRALLIVGDTLWAGGGAGLTAIDLTTDERTTQTLPWPEQNVRALVSASDGTIWALNATHLARRVNGTWQNVNAPFTSMRALTIDTNGDLWVGGGDSSGSLARYNGSWQPVNGIGDRVTALTVDQEGTVWAGTAGSGIYAHDAADPLDSWTNFDNEDGVASNYIVSAAATTDAVWFGTQPILGTSGAQGGIAIYTLATAQWSQQTKVNGLPADSTFPSATAAITALTVDENGALWAGSRGRVFVHASANAWVEDVDFVAGTLSVLAAGADRVIAGADSTLHQLDRTVTPGAAPTVALDTPADPTLSAIQDLVLTATAADQDETDAEDDEPQIINWEWLSDRDGPLCTSAGQCTLTTELLRLGDHTITVRVQDDEGVWSATDSVEITVEEVRTVYLPTILSVNPAGQ